MKTKKLVLYFTLILISTCTISAYGQGSNLQFNKIIQLNCPRSYPGHADSLSVTVPAGKIWKITSVLCPGGGGGQGQHLFLVSINGIICNTQLAGHFLTYQFTGYSGRFETPIFPIWLNQNDVVTFSCWNQVNSYHGIINVTEYNIVP